MLHDVSSMVKNYASVITNTFLLLVWICAEFGRQQSQDSRRSSVSVVTKLQAARLRYGFRQN
jgi:hypothetical protein